MNIISELKTILKNTLSPDMTVYYDSIEKINYLIDNTDNMPMAFIIRSPLGRFRKDMMGIGTELDLVIGFLDETEFDFDSMENEAILETLRGYAKTFLQAYDDSKKFELLPAEIPIEFIYNKFDRPSTGLMLSIICKARDFSCT